MTPAEYFDRYRLPVMHMETDHAELREVNGHVSAPGLYDLERRIRPVGEAYRRLIADCEGIVHTGLPLLSWAQ